MADTGDFEMDAVLNVTADKASIKKTVQAIQTGLKDIGIDLQVKNVREIDKVLNQVREISSGFDDASKKVVGFSNAVALSAKRATAYLIGTTALLKFSNQISQATSAAIKFDSELAKIAQTVNKSNKEIRTSSNEILNIAKQYGVFTTKVSETIRVLAQAGFTMKEAYKGAELLSKTTLLSSFEDLGHTTEGLISILKTFNLNINEAEDALDQINIVSKRYAVEAGDLIEGIKRVGGTFKVTGGDLREFNALFTSVRDTTREGAETIATSFRTIFARLQRPGTVKFFQDLGIELFSKDALSGQTKFIGNLNAIQAIASGLQRKGIAPGTLEFARVIEEIGGIRQSTKVITLLTQINKATKIYNELGQATTETAQDVAKAQDTLANKIQKLQENFAALIYELSQSVTFREIANIFINMSNAAIELSRSLKELIPIVGLLGSAYFSSKVFSALANKSSTGSLFSVFERLPQRASGGLVKGVGDKDSELSLLMPGEYIINKRSAQRFGYANLENINKYAAGGFSANTPIKDIEQAKSILNEWLKAFPSLEEILSRLQNFDVQQITKEQIKIANDKGIDPAAVFNKRTEKIGIVPNVTTSKELAHEVGHAIDLALGASDKRSTEIEGSFFNQLAKILKSQFKPTGVLDEYNSKPNELIANFLPSIKKGDVETFLKLAQKGDPTDSIRKLLISGIIPRTPELDAQYGLKPLIDEVKKSNKKVVSPATSSLSPSPPPKEKSRGYYRNGVFIPLGETAKLIKPPEERVAKNTSDIVQDTAKVADSAKVLAETTSQITQEAEKITRVVRSSVTVSGQALNPRRVRNPLRVVSSRRSIDPRVDRFDLSPEINYGNYGQFDVRRIKKQQNVVPPQLLLPYYPTLPQPAVSAQPVKQPKKQPGKPRFTRKVYNLPHIPLAQAPQLNNPNYSQPISPSVSVANLTNNRRQYIQSPYYRQIPVVSPAINLPSPRQVSSSNINNPIDTTRLYPGSSADIAQTLQRPNNSQTQSLYYGTSGGAIPVRIMGQIPSEFSTGYTGSNFNSPPPPPNNVPPPPSGSDPNRKGVGAFGYSPNGPNGPNGPKTPIDVQKTLGAFSKAGKQFLEVGIGLTFLGPIINGTIESFGLAETSIGKFANYIGKLGQDFAGLIAASVSLKGLFKDLGGREGLALLLESIPSFGRKAATEVSGEVLGNAVGSVAGSAAGGAIASKGAFSTFSKIPQFLGKAGAGLARSSAALPLAVAGAVSLFSKRDNNQELQDAIKSGDEEAALAAASRKAAYSITNPAIATTIVSGFLEDTISGFGNISGKLGLSSVDKFSQDLSKGIGNFTAALNPFKTATIEAAKALFELEQGTQQAEKFAKGEGNLFNGSSLSVLQGLRKGLNSGIGTTPEEKEANERSVAAFKTILEKNQGRLDQIRANSAAKGQDFGSYISNVSTAIGGQAGKEFEAAIYDNADLLKELKTEYDIYRNSLVLVNKAYIDMIKSVTKLEKEFTNIDIKFDRVSLAKSLTEGFGLEGVSQGLGNQKIQGNFSDIVNRGGQRALLSKAAVIGPESFKQTKSALDVFGRLQSIKEQGIDNVVVSGRGTVEERKKTIEDKLSGIVGDTSGLSESMRSGLESAIDRISSELANGTDDVKIGELFDTLNDEFDKLTNQDLLPKIKELGAQQAQGLTEYINKLSELDKRRFEIIAKYNDTNIDAFDARGRLSQNLLNVRQSLTGTPQFSNTQARRNDLAAVAEENLARLNLAQRPNDSLQNLFDRMSRAIGQPGTGDQFSEKFRTEQINEEIRLRQSYIGIIGEEITDLEKRMEVSKKLSAAQGELAKQFAFGSNSDRRGIVRQSNNLQRALSGGIDSVRGGERQGVLSLLEQFKGVGKLDFLGGKSAEEAISELVSGSLQRKGLTKEQADILGKKAAGEATPLEQRIGEAIGSKYNEIFDQENKIITAQRELIGMETANVDLFANSVTRFGEEVARLFGEDNPFFASINKLEGIIASPLQVQLDTTNVVVDISGLQEALIPELKAQIMQDVAEQLIADYDRQLKGNPNGQYSPPTRGRK